MHSTDLNEVAHVLRRSQRGLAICHVAPDGDAIGSLLGFGWVMAACGPGHVITLVCPDPIPAQFAFLPGAAEILSDPPRQAWDAVVSLDASDPRRLGKPFRPAEYGDAPVINLDHHVTNLNFGSLNYVDARAASTTQIVVDLADALAAPISQPAAICLLTGLVTDTLSFRTSNVTLQVMDTARRLMAAGANLAEIAERAMNHKPLGTMRLWGLALADLHLDGHVVWTHITQAMREAAHATEPGDGGLVGYLITAPEARISTVFTETGGGKVEIGFRARPGYDVSELALSLGGGGHPQAAGCTVDGPLAAVEQRVLPLLQSLTGPENKR